MFLLVFCPHAVQAAPVTFPGLSWQTTLDQNDRVLTYSFDHIGGYSIEAEGVPGTTTSLDSLFGGVIPDWENILTSALTCWGEAADITFVPVADSGSDLGAPGAQGDIRFSAHTLSQDVFGHSFYPMTTGETEASCGRSQYGDVHFATTMSWENYDLLATSIHELGHSLGVGHNLDPGSIMFPFVNYTQAETVSLHDLADIRALYFPVNAPAPVFTENSVSGHRGWLAIADGTETNRQMLEVLGHIDTHNEQQTAIKGMGESLFFENYAFDWTDLTLAVGGQLTTRGDNAYGLAVGGFNTLVVDGTIETSGMSSDGIAVLGRENQISTGPGSRIVTHGKGANGLFLGGDWNERGSRAVLDGQILTHGTGGAGVFISAQWTDLQLNGRITTLGDFGIGVCNLSSLASKVGIGEKAVIETSGSNAPGVLVGGAGSVISAEGQITTSGDLSHGIWVRAADNWAIIVNTGRITTLGKNSQGIKTSYDMTFIMHDGGVAVSGAGSTGLLLHDSSNYAVVSGQISSLQGDAISLGNSYSEGAAGGEENYLAIHGSPLIAGDIVNHGRENGAHITFGQSYDLQIDDSYNSWSFVATEFDVPGTDFVFEDNITGNLWTGDVLAGTTHLNGDLANFSLLTIAPGAILGGSTHYTGDMVNNGTLAPGNSMGTITIGGDYTQAGNLVMEIHRTGSDLLAVSGVAAFEDGAGLKIIPLAPLTTQSYSLVTAGEGISGSPVYAGEASLFLDFTLNASGGGLDLDVSRKAVYSDFAANTRHLSLAAALDTLIPTASGDLSRAMATMDMMTESAQVGQAYAALSPEEYGSLTEMSFSLTRDFTRFIFQGLADGRSKGQSGGAAYAGVMHLLGSRDSNNGFSGFDWKSNGLGFGLDYGFANAIAGVGIAVLDTNSNYDDNGFDSDTRSAMGGGYLSFFHESWHADFLAGYGNHQSDTDRIVRMGSFEHRLGASPKSDLYFTSAEIGFDHGIAWAATLSPFVGLDYLYNSRRAVSEGGSTLGVGMDKETAKSAHLTLGTTVSRGWQMGEQAGLYSFLKLAWAHDLQDGRYNLTGRLGDSDFHVQGYEKSADRALLSLGLLVKGSAATDLKLKFDGEWGEHFKNYGLQASFTHRF